MLADLGCDTRDTMAVTGHSTKAMVKLYTEEANTSLSAERAIAHLEEARHLGQGTKTG